MIEIILTLSIIFMFGLASGMVLFYVVFHKSEFMYTLSTIKEDVTNLTVRLENFISIAKK